VEDDFSDEVPLALDVLIERGLGELGLPGDVLHPDRAQSFPHDERFGRMENGLLVALAPAPLALLPEVDHDEGSPDAIDIYTDRFSS